ncbi:MAG: holo-ACP synthase [Thermaerobacter sp.]|nr:holo-ACP synthase [Thermaerobacter sp.]
MIVGTGVDIVSVARMAHALHRHPRLIERVFTVAEQAAVSPGPHAVATWASRFAAKEAVVKALGGWHGGAWRDIEVLSRPGHAPEVRLGGTIAQWAGRGGLTVWLSISHERDYAVAMAVAERIGP